MYKYEGNQSIRDAEAFSVCSETKIAQGADLEFGILMSLSYQCCCMAY